jgi:hypothetical protein
MKPFLFTRIWFFDKKFSGCRHVGVTGKHAIRFYQLVGETAQKSFCCSFFFMCLAGEAKYFNLKTSIMEIEYRSD